MFALAHFTCSHSTLWKLTSSSSILSSRTTSQVTLPINKHCATPPTRGVWPFGQYYFSHRLWAQRCRQLRLLRDNRNLYPGAIQRHDALVLAWRGAQWRDHRPSAERSLHHCHSGVRRTSGPWTSLSLYWRKFVASQSLSVCHVSTGRPANELSSLGSCSGEKPSREKEEVQKSHVLKVKELSRRKLTEDFIGVSFFQGANVKTVCTLGDNDAKCPDAEIDDEHTRILLASPQEREARASLLQVCHSQKRKLVSTCTVNISKYGKPVNWMSQKRKAMFYSGQSYLGQILLGPILLRPGSTWANST